MLLHHSWMWLWFEELLMGSSSKDLGKFIGEDLNDSEEDIIGRKKVSLLYAGEMFTTIISSCYMENWKSTQ
jgi:hypothetical protein